MAWSTPRTWVAGEKPSASTLNTHIRDNFAAVGDAWTSYTPTLGNATLGNGTLSAAYIQAGKLVQFRIKFVLGSTSAITGAVTFTLPVNATAARTMTVPAIFNDASGPFKIGGGYNSSTSVLAFRDDASAAISSTSPFTWATSDEIFVSGSYEAA
jgi:hypothetical protein